MEPSAPLTPDEQALIAKEKVRAYYNEAGDQAVAGALVQSINCFLVYEYVPQWTWLPGLLALYAITIVRGYLFRLYDRQPTYFSSARWAHFQALTGGLAGVSWGLSNMAMMAFLPVEYQLLLVVVTAGSAASSGNESFADPMPPRTFITAAVAPPALWLLTEPQVMHVFIGLMLLMLGGLTLFQGVKRHNAFIEALRLRFEKERLARVLEDQRDTITQAAQAKTRFLAAASHDLRQPVQALSIFLELLEAELPDAPRTHDLLHRARQAGESIHQLLDNLLDISKLDANVTQVKRTIFPLAPLLDQLHQEFAAMAKEKGLLLRTHRTRAWVDSDPVLLERILRNFITNALRYTARGKVLVGCHPRGDRLILGVWDTGIGIPETQQKAIFTEFFQVDADHTERKDGLGLGLAIVERITRLLEHPVSVQSVPGRGSCFSLGIPLAPAAMAMPAPLPASGATPLRGRTIAVVENNPDIRLALTTLLEKVECQVLAGSSVNDILTQAEAKDAWPHAIISDLGLGLEENGIQCIARLRAHFDPCLPALLVTGDTSKAALLAASQADLVLLHKPVSSQALLTALTQALAAREQSFSPFRR